MRITFFLLVFVCMAFVSFGQTKDSVTCIPNSQLREAVRSNERFKIASQENIILRKHIVTLSDIIVNRDSALTNASQVIKNKDTVISLMGIKVNDINSKYILANGYAENLNKQLTNQKAKTVLTGTVGGVVIVTLLYLFIKK